MINTVLTTLLLVLSFQVDRNELSLFLINDLETGRWCGFKDELGWKKEQENSPALVVGRVDVTKGKITRLSVTKYDETGDWAVFDVYSISASGQISGLKRTINVLPSNRSEEEVWVVHDGKATKTQTASRSLRTLRPITPTPIDLPDVPIVTELKNFDFWPLLADQGRGIISKGRACTP